MYMLAVVLPLIYEHPEGVGALAFDPYRLIVHACGHTQPLYLAAFFANNGATPLSIQIDRFHK
jgi:hypothetical protein